MWIWRLPTILEIAGRTAVVYFFLVLLVRLAGKRQIGQLTPFDLVVLLLLSNAVQNAMTGPDTSVTGGLVAALTLVILNGLVAFARLKSHWFRRCIEGVPVSLVIQGKVVQENLIHEQITNEELMASLREHEVSDVSKVELAMLEIDGSVSVIRYDPSKSGSVYRTRKRLVRHHRNAN